MGMVVYRCAECDATISRPVVDLSDLTLLRDDPDEAMTGTGSGEPDYVLEGFMIEGPTDAFFISDSEGNWPILNPEDLLKTTYDSSVETGCCGPPGREVNTDCRNGHKVAIERGDCYTLHGVALDPNRVVATDSSETVSPGLDEAGPSVWLEAVDAGSTSDRRRAIVLLGIHEVDSAIPKLAEIVVDGPDEIRETAVRALGRIGDPDSINTLTTPLAAEDRHLREIAAKAIGEIGGDRANRVLLERLLDETEGSVCSEIRSGIHSSPSFGEIRNYLNSAPAGPAQKTLLRVVPEGDSEKAADLFQDVIISTEFPTEVRKEAISQLRWLDEPKANWRDNEQIAPARIVEALAEVQEPLIRRACIWELRQYKNLDEETRETLLAILREIINDPGTDSDLRDFAEDYLDG